MATLHHSNGLWYIYAHMSLINITIQTRYQVPMDKGVFCNMFYYTFRIPALYEICYSVLKHNC